jgi:hypothetical protein
MPDVAPPRSAPREVRESVKLLRHVEAAAKALAGILEDLHVLAYDKTATALEDKAGGGGGRQTWYLDDVGKEAAKHALRELTSERSQYSAVMLERAMRVHYERVFSLFRGEGADESMRGTLLGDEHGHHPQGELNRLLKAQGRRRDRGEYSPVSEEEQRRKIGR